MRKTMLAIICATWLLGSNPGDERIANGRWADGVRDAPRAISSESIENFYRLGPGIYSGGDPVGEPAFRQLRDLGVRTVISVDGAAPDVESARRHGLRYVHLPIGYDGISKDQATRIVKALRAMPGPVFVHCHHGKHRGPAAAAICGMATEEWTRDDAVAWLEAAGTSREYAGLYDSVAGFTMPTDGELAAAGNQPERAEVAGLVEAMIEIDERWERLALIQGAGFQVPAGRPDLDPAHEALLLRESFRESARLPESIERGESFLEALAAAEISAQELEGRTRDGVTSNAARQRIEASFRRVGQSCKTCHIRFRN